MSKKININDPETAFNNFIEYRHGLSSFEKKLEAASLIEKIHRVDVNKAYEKVIQKINHKNKIHSAFETIIRIAAIMTLPLLAFTIWSLFFQKENFIPETARLDKPTWQHIESPAGMRSHIILPDGTNLWLNAGSNLRYTIPFAGKTREVDLEGEAFLDVIKNNNSPFRVNLKNTSVEVIGTQFNVRSYPGSETVDIALKEGRIKFTVTDSQNKIKTYQLTTNDYLQYNKDIETVRLDNRNIEKYIAWHNNIMILDDTPMEEVARLLEQWYGIKVILNNNEIKSYKFTTTFDNEPLFRVLELLELSSPISIKYIPGKPDPITKKLSQSLVTITKKQLPM
jgi:hypothetical protein